MSIIQHREIKGRLLRIEARLDRALSAPVNAVLDETEGPSLTQQLDALGESVVARVVERVAEEIKQHVEPAAPTAKPKQKG